VSWNPAQYERFKAERRQPFDDLLALVHPRPRMRVVDLGCGTGELTRELHAKLGAAETLGVDSSARMLEKANAFAGDGLRFVQSSIELFAPEQPLDLVFSNAALHWVDDHEALFARLTTFLAPEGQLAIQMPANVNHLSHVTAAEVARELRIEPRVAPLLAPERYAEMLYRLGYPQQVVRLHVYGHVLDSSADVIEWVKGTLLTDYERRAGDRWPQFLAGYREQLLAKLGDQRPYFFSYRRILIWCARS
jgi:trans-aconitate 2-methyltransferase